MWNSRSLKTCSAKMARRPNRSAATNSRPSSVNYLNNIVEQDHRAIKRIPRPMLGFKTFRCARILIAGIEIMHMIRKGQLGDIKDQASSPATQFYSLAF